MSICSRSWHEVAIRIVEDHLNKVSYHWGPDELLLHYLNRPNKAILSLENMVSIDGGLRLCEIGIKYGLDGDSPQNFIHDLIEAYNDPFKKTELGK